MIKWYYNKVWLMWLKSDGRYKMIQKRNLPEKVEMPMERKIIYSIYTILSPIVIIEFVILGIYKKIKRSDQ